MLVTMLTIFYVYKCYLQYKYKIVLLKKLHFYFIKGLFLL